jgi:hypothetical protein
LGVFEFVIVLVLISTAGKVFMDRQEIRALEKGRRAPDSGEIELLRESVQEMNDRLHVLEEERDFYRSLLEAPKKTSGPENT